jgi:uncharacterized protein YqgV (UPF0045/DUF77 family)
MKITLKEMLNMITAEIAVYPLKTDNATKVINDSRNAIKGSGVDCRVNSMNTVLSGDKDDVFNCIKTMFTEAEKSGGEVSMVVTVGNAYN